jgi:hypothetical protein
MADEANIQNAHRRSPNIIHAREMTIVTVIGTLIETHTEMVTVMALHVHVRRIASAALTQTGMHDVVSTTHDMVPRQAKTITVNGRFRHR